MVLLREVIYFLSPYQILLLRQFYKVILPCDATVLVLAVISDTDNAGGVLGDFERLDEMLMFPIGETMMCTNITINEDSNLEQIEFFQVAGSYSSGEEIDSSPHFISINSGDSKFCQLCLCYGRALKIAHKTACVHAYVECHTTCTCIHGLLIDHKSLLVHT